MIYDLEREEAVVGSVLVAPRTLDLILETGLTYGHFYTEPARSAFESICALADQGITADHLMVEKDTGRQVEYLTLMATPQARAHAKALVDMAMWRHRWVQAQAMTVACEARNEEQFGRVESELLYGFRRTDEVTFSPDDLADRLYAHLSDAPERFDWPFVKLDDCTSGGMRRGEVTLIGGWSSHGKSAFLDQCLQRCADRGHKTHLYINEMTPTTRAMRWVARQADVDLKYLLRGELNSDEQQRAVGQLGRIPYAMTDAAGWSAAQIARHVRRLKADVVGIDILHLIAHRDERDLADISQTLNTAAKMGNCHLLVTVHLNENRVMGQTRPMPTLGDIRGSGMLKNDADNVLFVFREQDADTGYPQEEGRIYFSKVRMGIPGGVETRFNGSRMTFQEAIPGWV